MSRFVDGIKPEDRREALAYLAVAAARLNAATMLSTFDPGLADKCLSYAEELAEAIPGYYGLVQLVPGEACCCKHHRGGLLVVMSCPIHGSNL